MRCLSHKNGFALLEYIIVFVCVVVGLLYMACYLRRGIQGSLRGVQQDLSPQMYLPGHMDTEVTTKLKGKASFGSGTEIGAITYYLHDEDAEGETLTTNVISHTIRIEEGHEYIQR